MDTEELNFNHYLYHFILSGEEEFSYGFGGTGMFSENSKFRKYGGSFTLGDTITAMVDLESRPPYIAFMKNGVYCDVAVRLNNYKLGDKKMALFPHILTKNCR